MLTYRQVSKPRKAFLNNFSVKLSKIVQSGEFFGRHLGPLMKFELLLIENVLNH